MSELLSVMNIKMASEAQRLIGISLTKIAQSRSHRGGVSLHRNLLVATVLQKARYLYMEEAYGFPPPAPVQARPVPEEELIGLTAEDAGLPDEVQETSSSDSFEVLQPSCVKCQENQNKENQPPTELTYLDLDKPNVLRERSSSSNCLKRRRAVAEWETEEAVQSILPKRSKQDEEEDEVFVENAATTLSDSVAKEVEVERGGSAMEIDRITSLVSIFSFSMGENKLNRSVSTPDLCSAQAKDADTLQQQRPFLAMTV